MAGIESLKNKIKSDGEQKAQQIIEDAQNKSTEIIKNAGEKAKVLQDEAVKRAEIEGKDLSERIIAGAELDARDMILSAKQEIIDKSLKMTELKISNMGKKDYSDLIYKLLIASVETGNEKIIFSFNDMERIDLDILQKINKKLVSEGRTGNLKVGGYDKNIKNGFILKQGSIEINCSIESQIRAQRDSMESDIADLLFEDK